MYIIVVGGGKVGYHLAKTLLGEGHEVLVIEKERSRVEFICSELGSICLHGDGCEAATQAEAGAVRANMLIAVTGDDGDNLVACQVAKHKYKVPRTIARMTNPKNEALFRMLGVDVTVSSTNVIMENIQQEVPTHVLTHLFTIQDRGLEIVEIKIPSDSGSVGKKIKELSLPVDSLLMLVMRHDKKPMMVTVDTVIQTGDQIVALTPTDTEEQLKNALMGN
jgi:trk system potassium uptake protein